MEKYYSIKILVFLRIQTENPSAQWILISDIYIYMYIYIFISYLGINFELFISYEYSKLTICFDKYIFWIISTSVNTFGKLHSKFDELHRIFDELHIIYHLLIDKGFLLMCPFM